MRLSKENKPFYGGLAVINGVMFSGKNIQTTTVRLKDSTFDHFDIDRKEFAWAKKLRKIPIVRGLVSVVESSANGNRHLNFSAERMADLPKEAHDSRQSKLVLTIGVAAAGVISFIFGKIAFTVIPALIAGTFFKSWFPGHVEQNIVEGVIKFLLLLSYIYLISMTPMIRRVLQYHGAEHKVINCYERGMELTVQNVQQCSRYHYRCGSSFIMFTIIIGMFVYMIVPTDPLIERILYRLLLLPVVIGISFEVLFLTNKVRSIPIAKYLGYPGIWVQFFTTKQPMNDQVEVSIASFKRLLELEKANGEVLEYTKQIGQCKKNNETSNIDAKCFY